MIDFSQFDSLIVINTIIRVKQTTNNEDVEEV